MPDKFDRIIFCILESETISINDRASAPKEIQSLRNSITNEMEIQFQVLFRKNISRIQVQSVLF
ncbi:hypothetical protein DLM78_07225 [Leptospira stimsonii]|uniref:Uncharacterized protein n=1 Tax=Leptospira stimsonii TaxID=2202203 RepID=A0A8B3CX36_9LEPT|nr:hypothetical protein DLM78_07225 [Leptospira stimsonii]